MVFFVLRPAVPCGLGRASLILDGLVKSTSKGPKVKIFSLFFSKAQRDTICVVRVYFMSPPPLVLVPNPPNLAHGQAMLGS